jgi:aminoglycoside phosphotransferase (APT) family kinase protein
MTEVRPGSLTPALACETLREAGLTLAPAKVRVEAREERWAVWLPGDRMAWFPAGERGRHRLAVERKVLRLLAERCTFQAPRILFESPVGYDVRAIVPGHCDPWSLYERIKDNAALARRIGRALGAILVEQHTRIADADVAGWLSRRVPWPEPAEWIRERIPHVVNDRRLIAAIERTFAIYEAAVVDPDDSVLLHGDLGLHNVVVDPATFEVRGVFDYDGAAWADRHHDFRYLFLDIEQEELLEAALAVYEPAIGRTLSRERIWLYNTACAISYLAYRRGVPTEQRHCGRTLAEDLGWVRSGIERLGTMDG